MNNPTDSHKWSISIFFLHLPTSIPRPILYKFCPPQSMGKRSHYHNYLNGHFILRVRPTLGPNIILSSSSNYQPVFCSPANRKGPCQLNLRGFLRKSPNFDTILLSTLLTSLYPNFYSSPTLIHTPQRRIQKQPRTK